MGFRASVDYGKSYFLSINSNGNLYERSSEQKEGFVEHINQMTNKPSGYWKEYPGGITGYLNHIGIKSRTNQQNQSVDYFNMVFKDYELNESFVISFPMLTSKGGLHRYVKSFVKFFENIDYSRELYFNAFKRRPEDEYAPSELTFAYVGENGERDVLIERHFKGGEQPGTVGLNGWPCSEKSVGLGGKQIISYQNQDNFAYAKLKEYIDSFSQNIGNIRANISEKYGVAVYRRDEQPEAPQEVQAPQEPSSFVKPQPEHNPAPQASKAPSVSMEQDDLPF